MKEEKKPKFSYNESQKKQEAYQSLGSFIFEIVKIVLLAFLIFAPIRFFIFQPFFVQGASMEPNFENNEYLIINEIGYKQISLGRENKIFQAGPFRDLERSWPIVFRYPKNPSQYFIKRVIALPGEKIQIKDNQIVIFNDEFPNGFLLDESAYLDSYVETKGDLTLQLADDEYFVMGDNRSFSSDSRSWGPVNKEDIIGKVLLRAWPLSEIKIF